LRDVDNHSLRVEIFPTRPRANRYQEVVIEWTHTETGKSAPSFGTALNTGKDMLDIPPDWRK
jgi:hypothetical protein